MKLLINLKNHHCRITTHVYVCQVQPLNLYAKVRLTSSRADIVIVNQFEESHAELLPKLFSKLLHCAIGDFNASGFSLCYNWYHMG